MPPASKKPGRPSKTIEERDADAWERFCDALFERPDEILPNDPRHVHWFCEGLRFPFPGSTEKPTKWISASRYAWMGGPWGGGRRKLTLDDSLVRNCEAPGCIRPEHQKFMPRTTTPEKREAARRKSIAQRAHKQKVVEWGKHLERISE